MTSCVEIGYLVRSSAYCGITTIFCPFNTFFVSSHHCPSVEVFCYCFGTFCFVYVRCFRRFVIRKAYSLILKTSALGAHFCNILFLCDNIISPIRNQCSREYVHALLSISHSFYRAVRTAQRLRVLIWNVCHCQGKGNSPPHSVCQ